jgi:uncharacterized damage-inducible protein DinB
MIRTGSESNQTSRVDRAFLLRLLDEAYDRKAWHGPNLKGSIRGVTAEQAAWRPGRNRRNIAETIVHCAYWKYRVRKRLAGDNRVTFPLKGRNWFELPTPLTLRQWRVCITLLDAQHRALREAVQTLPQARVTRLDDRPGKSPANQIFGVALHDTYHAGQIRHLRALREAVV